MPHRSLSFSPLRPWLVSLALATLTLGLSLPGASQVVRSGILGERALLLVGSSAPKAVAPEEALQGEGRVSLAKDSALLKQGRLNGQIMPFGIDTGATVVPSGRADAKRMGLAHAGGQPMPIVLLGNCLMNRFQRHRVHDRMVLEKWL